MKLGAIGAIAVSVVIAGGALAGCSSSNSSGSSSSPTASSSSMSVPSEYTKEIETVFVGACVQAAQTNGTSEADAAAICGCTYRGIAAKIPFQDYVKADENASKGSPVPTIFTSIRDECNKDPNTY